MAVDRGASARICHQRSHVGLKFSSGIRQSAPYNPNWTPNGVQLTGENMKKILSILLISVMAAAIVTGCGSKADEGTETATTGTTGAAATAGTAGTTGETAGTTGTTAATAGTTTG